MDDAEYETPPGPISLPGPDQLALANSRLELNEIVRHLDALELHLGQLSGAERAYQLARAAELWRALSDVGSDMARLLEEHVRDGFVRGAAETPTLRDTPVATLAPWRRRVKLAWRVSLASGLVTVVLKFVLDIIRSYHPGWKFW